MTKPVGYPNEPEKLWDIFYDFTQTPRPSKNEGEISNYLVNLAKSNDLKYNVDKAGNIIIYVPGKNGRENDEPVIIQNHIDMVTDALPNIKINFNKDPLSLKMDGKWLKAEGTTLGADNGIGCAASLVPIFDKEMIHPPLELLFTTDEETGLNGALGLESKYLTGKKMLNLDTEEWGSLYIGCAGGIHYEFNKDLEFVSSTKDFRIKIVISDFIGGHSGIDIQEQRGNANKVMTEILFELSEAMDYELEEFRGGKAHNIIPRDAYAILKIDKDNLHKLDEILKEKTIELKGYLPQNDLNFKILIEELPNVDKSVLKLSDRENIVNFLTLFPNGAHAFDLPSGGEIVSMSNNMAIVIIMNGKFYTLTSLRFFDRNEIKSLEKKLVALGRTFNIKVDKGSEYPSWKPVIENSVLEVVKESYQALFNKEAIVTAIHAGLECGILKDKIGDIEVCSFGPTIMGAHSPDERVDTESVKHFWNLFKNVLERI